MFLKYSVHNYTGRSSYSSRPETVYPNCLDIQIYMYQIQKSSVSICRYFKFCSYQVTKNCLSIHCIMVDAMGKSPRQNRLPK